MTDPFYTLEAADYSMLLAMRSQAHREAMELGWTKLDLHAIETYRHEIAYHTERYNAHYSNVVGWASR